MANLNKTMVKVLSDEEREQLSPDRYSKHASRVIRDTLMKYRNGMTVKDMEEKTRFNKGTIEKHLIELVAINFAYRKKFGTAYVYYPNGRTMHSTLEKNIEIGDKVYSIFILDNENEEKYVYIQEKKRDSINALKPSGGILIREDFFQNFIDMLNSVSNTIKNVEVRNISSASMNP